MARIFLLGAGASVEAGIPASRAMVRRIYDELSRTQDSGNGYVDLFNRFRHFNRDDEVVRALNVALGGLRMQRAIASGSPFDDVDVEDLYETLETLAERKNSALAPFVGSWTSSVASAERGDPAAIAQDIAHGWRADREGRLSHMPHLQQALERLIDGEDSGNSFRRAAAAVLEKAVELTWISEQSAVDYFRSWLERLDDDPIWIATLNYDNSIELAARAAGKRVDTGLRGSAIDFSGVNDSSTIRLAKLHGSVSWAYEASGTMKDHGAPQSSAPVIFGSGNKLRPDGPYLDLLLSFRDRLHESQELLCCGYSFRDWHINHFILDWLSRKQHARVRVGDPALTPEGIARNLARSSRRWSVNEKVAMSRFEVESSPASKWLNSV